MKFDKSPRLHASFQSNAREQSRLRVMYAETASFQLNHLFFLRFYDNDRLLKRGSFRERMTAFVDSIREEFPSQRPGKEIFSFYFQEYESKI